VLVVKRGDAGKTRIRLQAGKPVAGWRGAPPACPFTSVKLNTAAVCTTVLRKLEDGPLSS